MKKAIEKFRTAQKYIAEKDYSRLTAMLNNILSSDSAKLFDDRAEAGNKLRRFEVITDYMIVKELINMSQTDPDFFTDDLFELCCNAEKNLYFPNFNHVYLDYSKLSSLNEKQRAASIRLIFRKAYIENYSFEDRMTCIEQIVWFSAFEENDIILDELYNLAEEKKLLQISICIDLWMWMYLEAIVTRKRFDLLDKITELNYKKVNYEFTKYSCSYCSNLTYSDFVYLLYKRYRPEISDSEIGEKLLYSDQYSITYRYSLDDFTYVTGAEPEFIMKLNMKTANVNCVLALWILSEYKLEKEYMYSLLKEKPVLYLNDRWLEVFTLHEENTADKFGILLDFLKGIPDISISMDNHDNAWRWILYFGNIQLKRLFSVCRPTITDKIITNQILIEIISMESKSKKLKPFLEVMELDEEAIDGLIELCVACNNTYALGLINNKVKKEKNSHENINL